MVSYVVHRKTRNPEVWRLTAEEKLVSHRCPQLMTKRKTTLFILLTNSCSCFIFSSGLSLQALLTMVIAISIFLAFKTEREKGRNRFKLESALSFRLARQNNNYQLTNVPLVVYLTHLSQAKERSLI